MLSAEAYAIMVELAWPIFLLIIGAFIMRRTGLLPQQKRLDELYREVINTQDDQLQLRDRAIAALQQQQDELKRGAQTEHARLAEALATREVTITALQAALVSAQQQVQTMQAGMADNAVKMGALVRHQRGGGSNAPH